MTSKQGVVHTLCTTLLKKGSTVHTYLLNRQSCPHWSVRSALFLIHNGCSRACLRLASSRPRPAPEPTTSSCEPCHVLGNEAISPRKGLQTRAALPEPDHSVCRMLTVDRPASVAYIYNGAGDQSRATDTTKTFRSGVKYSMQYDDRSSLCSVAPLPLPVRLLLSHC